ncbi:PIG-L deacetylase family protein [Virgisporangium ochraceum]|uniref:Acetylglucosaminylphosphatidylinositol deacetylase n=1 Tax=Virgisporangium ochraceum TaxID=65505 RepID=A0A8J4A366_9ACTN|nr:PIG-L family deacetylase [Virgisporangium ochraceum]GIJ74281.1 acetylglucosaminylphosphatidylinositol deacetylase [Virgisporangium ochraceum]
MIAIEGDGTDEAAWSSLDAFPALEWDAHDPPLVVAPHPDDEILGVGGAMAILGAADVFAVTDGEASHPGSTVYTPAKLAALRREETDAALDRLGVDPVLVHRLGQPDGGIDEAALAAALTPLLWPGRWCFATWRGDGHPDHEAVGRAAATACARTGARLLEYPVWMWHWARPGDPRVPWERARRIDLDADVRERKRAAVAEFRSQTGPLGPEPADAPILPPAVLARFERPFETVLV